MMIPYGPQLSILLFSISRNEDFVQLAPSDAPFSALRSPNWMRTRGAKPDTARRQQRKRPSES